MCPALSSGYFMEKVTAFQAAVVVSSVTTPGLVSQSGVLKSSAKKSNLAISEKVSSQRDTEKNEKVSAEKKSKTCTISNTNLTQTESETNTSNKSSNIIKIGIVSGQIRNGHIVGDLVLGLITVFRQIENIEVTIYHTDIPAINNYMTNDDIQSDGSSTTTATGIDTNNLLIADNTPDLIRSTVDQLADRVFYLSLDLNKAAQTIRDDKLHILIYPEIGLDPITYFLSFAKLAKHQLCLFGHPDTTG